jgi:DNA-3-methyladenine glycosylase
VTAAALDGAGAPAPLPRSFFARPTIKVARDLLGKWLVRRWPDAPLQIARIVEVEAYLGERDAASHARRGPTPRAAIMFGPPGFLYVYLVYGMHHCLNLVTEADGTAGAVLVRAADPVSGFEAAGAADARGRSLLSGPGKLCAALEITLRDKGLDLTQAGAFFVAGDGRRPPRRAASPRIGVDYAGAWAKKPWRFVDADSPWLSKKLK